jgi:FAD/FMN-containing dehydrogenase
VAIESSVISDGCVAQDTTQSKSLWSLRESIAESLGKEGAVYKYDVSLPVKDMYSLVLNVRDRLTSSPRQLVGGVVGYGHLGDGNLHLNVYAPKLSAEVLGKLEPYIFEQTGQKCHRGA